jgi:hypothetical protein
MHGVYRHVSGALPDVSQCFGGAGRYVPTCAGKRAAIG